MTRDGGPRDVTRDGGPREVTRDGGPREVTRIAIVGPGRLGTLLATAASRAGYRVAAVAGGDAHAQARLTARVAGTRAVDDPVDAAAMANLLVLTTPPDALEPVVRNLVGADALGDGHRMVHVAAGLGLEPLVLAARAGARVAACHPAVVVPTGTTDPGHLVGVPWAVTADASERPWADELVRDLGGDPHAIAADRRALYGAAVTLAGDAVAAATVAARQLLLAAAHDAPADVVERLGATATAPVRHGGAAALADLSGPVVRGDVATLRAELTAVADDLPALSPAQRQALGLVLAMVRAGLDADVADHLDGLLAGGRSPGSAG